MTAFWDTTVLILLAALDVCSWFGQFIQRRSTFRLLSTNGNRSPGRYSGAPIPWLSKPFLNGRTQRDIIRAYSNIPFAPFNGHEPVVLHAFSLRTPCSDK
ncbi:hypothetical protein BKA70DRAFT_399370 [Coprinopsis sp. MPI-PUGE-AT-0042]|nr:hypothetical protein BKA70DRAFT_399370 [Coprinopsis sp. MPI-PUGE-AT-0042]